MICFQDRTFCIADCANEECRNKLTEKVTAAAEEWWGKQGAPISTWDCSQYCPDYVEIKQ
jgi:hypothetical protein